MTVTAKLSPMKYGRLLAQARPVVIETKDEYRRMLAEVDKLMDKNLNPEFKSPVVPLCL